MMADAGLRSWRLQKLDHDETRAKQIEDWAAEQTDWCWPKTPIYLRHWSWSKQLRYADISNWNCIGTRPLGSRGPICGALLILCSARDRSCFDSDSIQIHAACVGQRPCSWLQAGVMSPGWIWCCLCETSVKQSTAVPGVLIWLSPGQLCAFAGWSGRWQGSGREGLVKRRPKKLRRFPPLIFGDEKGSHPF